MKRKHSGSLLRKVRLSLGQKSHDVFIGENAVRCLDKFRKEQTFKRAFVIADERLEGPRKRLLENLKNASWDVHEIPVQAGEDLKDFKTIYPIYGDLLKKRANRDSVIFALGGGTVGDAGGFVASTFLRGVPWVGVPTTLLAQVDSSIGGKTGINHVEGKNLIGSFYQPTLVVCDTEFLKSLDLREITSGFGEMLKYGFIFDAKFLQFLVKNQSAILSLDEAFLTPAIEKCVQWKTRVVAKDEYDRKGLREALNFGHTFAHALESITQYRGFRHGEAVIWGMRFALALSAIRKKMDSKKRSTLDRFLSKIEIPALPSRFTPQEFFNFMNHDKKVRNGKIHFVLLKEPGKTVSDPDVSALDLHRAFELMMNSSVKRKSQ